MATDRFDEVIRIVLESSGAESADKLKRALDQIGDAGEAADPKIAALLDEIETIGKATAAVATLENIAKKETELGQAADAAGLKLKLATQEQQAATQARQQSVAALDAAKAAQAAYAASEERTTAGTREHAAAVREANAQNKAAGVELARTETALTEATAGYTKAATAQSRLGDQSREANAQLRAAGVSTKDLGAAAAELGKRAQTAGAGVSDLAADAQRLRASTAAAAAEEQRLVRAIQEAGAQQRQAERATESLAEARATLAARTKAATASEQQSATSLGVSAGKIAALGAAALGIGSALDLARRGLSDLLETAVEYEKLDLQLDRKFGDDADKAREKIDQFRTVLPGVQESLLKLKAFGLDPLDGSFDAIINGAADLGGSMETLEGITLALGQAYAKQKLQGEEILQLVERGVPVWDLLSKATGKNVVELQKLSQEGKLGRDVIKALIDEIGKSSAGAADALGNTLGGQINRLKQQWTEFLNLIANSGVLDYLQQQLKLVGDEVARLAATGELQAWAKSVAEGIVGAAKAIQSTTLFLIEHKDTILALGAAYAASKIVDTTIDLTKGVIGLGAGAGAASTGLKGIASTAGVAAGAIIYTANNIVELVEVISELNRVSELLAKHEKDAADQRTRNAGTAAALRKELAQYADQARLTADQLSGLSAEEQQRYADGLQSAQRYWQAVKVEARQAGDATAEAVAVDKINAYGTAIIQATTDIANLGKAAKEASRDLVMEGVTGLMENLAKLRQESGSTSLALAQIAKDANFTVPEAPAILAKSLQYLKVEGQAVSDTLGREMTDALARLDAQSLGNFEANAVKALENGKISAKELATILDITLQAALQKLGVSANAAGVSVTSSGAEMIATFKLVASNAQATGLQIERALEAAVAKASTKAELKALGDALEEAGKRGTVSLAETERAMISLRARTRELDAELDPLAEQFAQLGIKSQKALDGARDSAREAFEAIAKGAAAGTKNQGDLVRAFEAMAAAERAAVAESTQSERDRVERALAQKAALLGITGILEEMGSKGKEAGEKISLGLGAAKESTDALAKSAELAKLGYAELLYDANKGNEAAQKMLQAIKDGKDTTSYAATGVQTFTAAIVGATTQFYVASDAMDEFNATTNKLDFYTRNLGRTVFTSSEELAAYEKRLDDATEATDRLAAITRQLQDERDRANGNEAKVAQREYADQVAEITDLINKQKVARQNGNLADTASLVNGQEALKLAQQAHRERMAQLQEETKQRNATAAAATAQQTASTPPSRPPQPSAPSSAAPVVNQTNNFEIHGIFAGSVQELARMLKPELDKIARLSQ